MVIPRTGEWTVKCSARGCNGTCSEEEAAEQEEYWGSPDDDWTASEVESPVG
jgi:hypothetical protein